MRVSTEIQLSRSLSSLEKDTKIHNSFGMRNSMEGEIPENTVWTARKILLFISMMYANFCLATCYALPAPFYPHEAEKKGASPTVYGLVFGAFQLTNAVMSPIWGKLIAILRPRFLVIAGIFLAGCCSILFGLLDKCPPGLPFIVLSFCVRILEATGVTAYLTASYGIIPIEFPGNVAKSFSAMETSFGLGMIVGPTVGGILYQFGGYSLPFVVMGVLLLTGTFATFKFFPEKYDELPGPTASILVIIGNSEFLVDLLVYFICFLVIGFNEATLEPHLRQFHLQPYILGLIFMVNGLTYSVSAPIWGYFCDKGVNGQTLAALGCGFCTLCFVFIGPAPFLCFNTSLHLVILSQVMLGVGTGSQLICAYIHGLQNVVERGFPNNISTYALFSGMMTVVAGLGAFVGPSLGGILLEHTGYKMGTSVIASIEVVVMILVIAYKLRIGCLNRRIDGEKKLLLRKEAPLK